MYNNIGTDHACMVDVCTWLDKLAPLISKGFPVQATKVTMNHTMHNNLFEWDVLCFVQLLETVMGTSTALMSSTTCFIYHKTRKIILKYSSYFFYFNQSINGIDDIRLLVRRGSAWKDFTDDQVGMYQSPMTK